MSSFLIFLSLAGGIVFLTIGAEGLIRGSIAIGKNFRLSPLLMGLTLVAFGTSSPELVASLQAAFAGSPGIALGNVVGSNIFNIAAILGLTAVLTGTISLAPGAWRRDGLTMLAATALLAVTLQFLPVLGRLLGLGLLVALAAYTFLAFRADKATGKKQVAEEVSSTPKMHTFFATALIIAGLVGLILGANLLVNAATALAKLWGVSETVIGLTIVACGTSLPELATSIIAALKKQTDIAIGNIIGSNIFNLLGIVGATALLHPVAVPAQMNTEAWILLALTTVFILTTRAGYRFSRPEGALFLAGFALYLWHLLA
jgi:cation:H+ antiporter